jgi:hypothetical protein
MVVLPIVGHFNYVDLLDERKRREVFAKVWAVYHFKDRDVPALFLHDVVLECGRYFSEAESTV